MIVHVSDAEKRWTAIGVDRETYCAMYARVNRMANSGSIYAPGTFAFLSLRAQLSYVHGRCDRCGAPTNEYGKRNNEECDTNCPDCEDWS